MHQDISLCGKLGYHILCGNKYAGSPYELGVMMVLITNKDGDKK
jgi:hypothetical protein